MHHFIDKRLEKIYSKIESGIRLSFDDGMILFNSSDLISIGYLADIVRRKKNKDNAYFICNRHINYTNICSNECMFCAFYKDKYDSSAYHLSVDDILKKAESFKNVSEFHIVGGLNNDLPFKYYTDLLYSLKERFPDVHIQAFTAVEIDHLSRIGNLSLSETLKRLKDAGLGSIPGGGAEILGENVRKEICGNKITGDRWCDVMITAHNTGLRSNATMLYGHIEKDEDRVLHMIKLREIQDKTGGFMSFIPLAFHPKNTALNSLSATTAHLDLKALAVSRLMLDNFQHIKAFWIMIGLKLAQISLSFGVDDIDGTVVEEKITHSAGAETAQLVKKEELIRIIKDAGRIPVERDTLYNVISVY